MNFETAKKHNLPRQEKGWYWAEYHNRRPLLWYLIDGEFNIIGNIGRKRPKPETVSFSRITGLYYAGSELPNYAVGRIIYNDNPGPYKIVDFEEKSFSNWFDFEFVIFLDLYSDAERWLNLLKHLTKVSGDTSINP